jgi:hypothetical protein
LILGKPLLDSILALGNYEHRFDVTNSNITRRVTRKSGVRTEKKEKASLAHCPGRLRPWRYAIPRRQRWERQQRGVDVSLLDVSLKSRRLR